MTDTPADPDRVDALLAAPAGRRLVAEVAGVSFASLLDALALPLPPGVARLSSAPAKRRRRGPRRRPDRRVVFDPFHRTGRSRHELAVVHRRAVSEAAPQDVSAAVRRLRTDPGRRRRVDVGSTAAVLEALEHVIVGFGFWGDEAGYDHLLRAAAAELRLVGAELVSSPATRWWWDEVLRHDQRYAEPAAGGSGPPRGAQVTEQTTEAVGRLRTEESVARHRHSSAADVPPNASGEWWSIPVPGLLTSRAIAPVPALHLACAEDRGDERAVVWSLRIAPAARVFEVRQPSDWARLVELAPLEVTMSRLGDWRRWTGRGGPFYLPDWSVVAEHFDGVHLTVGGYLTTRSVPVPVAGGYSVLAGWDPDVTLWLRDSAVAVERVGEWGGPATGTPWG